MSLKRNRQQELSSSDHSTDEENDHQEQSLIQKKDEIDIKERIEKLNSTFWTRLTDFNDEKVSASIKSTEPFCSTIEEGLLKKKLKEAWHKTHEKKEKKEEKKDEEDSCSLDPSSPYQKTLFNPLLSHMDIYDFCASWTKEKDRREIYCLHILNELLTAQSKITRNNQKLFTKQSSEELDDDARDQGFTRPRIVILVPFRNAVLDIVKCLISIWTASGGNVDNQKRLLDEYGPNDEDVEADMKRRINNQPADFINTFRDNTDDCFRLGIKCTRKSLKLFCDFYSSDIIIASPLGLRMIIDGQSETKVMKIPGSNKTKKKRIVKKGDYDFLSSIQCLVIDQADAIYMQNWEHLLHVLQHLNQLPKKSHGCDFSRVENVFLDALACHKRQTVVFSEFVFPELNALVDSLSNVHGAIKFEPSTYPNAMKRLHQHGYKFQFHPILTEQVSMLPAERLKYFIEKISPLIAKTLHTCIFIPSYLDFVQVREYFQSRGLSYAVISEYCTPSEISAARSRFFNNHAQYLLVTERFYFFKRHQIRGVKKMIWYALPDHADYFEQCTRWLNIDQDSKLSSKSRAAMCQVDVLISTFDRLKAERILGNKLSTQLFHDA